MNHERIDAVHNHAARKMLCDALKTACGNTRFARMSEVYEAARQRFGYRGTLVQALTVLNATPGVYVEQADRPESCRVLDGRVKQ